MAMFNPYGRSIPSRIEVEDGGFVGYNRVASLGDSLTYSDSPVEPFTSESLNSSMNILREQIRINEQREKERDQWEYRMRCMPMATCNPYETDRGYNYNTDTYYDPNTMSTRSRLQDMEEQHARKEAKRMKIEKEEQAIADMIKVEEAHKKQESDLKDLIAHYYAKG